MEKRKASEWNPRPGDLPVKELVTQANKEIADGWEVHFKFTCAYCGERCTLNEANTMWPQGECFQCGEVTLIDVGGFLKSRVAKGEDISEILKPYMKGDSND